MFGRGKKKQFTAPKGIAVETIPADFYAGADPVVTFKKVPKEISLFHDNPQLGEQHKKIMAKETAVGANKPLHPANLLTNRRFLIIAGSVFFVVAVIIISIYYYRQAKNAVVSPPPPAPVITQPAAENLVPKEAETVPPLIVPTSTAITEPASNLPLQFPSKLLADSVDLDNDGLSDVEEELFKTDRGVPDTDGDGYLDGSEVYHLYDPIKANSARIINSEVTNVYRNPVFDYSLIYPATWAVGAVDVNNEQVLFSTFTGEFIEVRVFEKDSNQTFNEWFALWAPQERLADLVEDANDNDYPSFRRSDSLVYYYETPIRIFVIMYHITTGVELNYRSVMEMVAHSFTLPVSAVELTPLADIVPTVTTTSELDAATTSTVEGF